MKIIKIKKQMIYHGLGFPIRIFNIKVFKDRDFIYHDIRMVEIMTLGALKLILTNEVPDGRRLLFIRQYIGYSKKRMAKYLDLDLETYEKIELKEGKSINMNHQKLRKLLRMVKEKALKEFEYQMESKISLAKDNMKKDSLIEIN